MKEYTEYISRNFYKDADKIQKKGAKSEFRNSEHNIDPIINRESMSNWSNRRMCDDLTNLT